MSCVALAGEPAGGSAGAAAAWATRAATDEPANAPIVAASNHARKPGWDDARGGRVSIALAWT